MKSELDGSLISVSLADFKLALVCGFGVSAAGTTSANEVKVDADLEMGKAVKSVVGLAGRIIPPS